MSAHSIITDAMELQELRRALRLKIAWLQACDDQEEHAIFLEIGVIGAMEHGQLWAASSQSQTKKAASARRPQRSISRRVLGQQRNARCWSISTPRAIAPAASALIVTNVRQASTTP